jgi:hypothetical protein
MPQSTERTNGPDPVKMGRDGKPWGTREAAEKHLADEQLDLDVWGVTQRAGKWIIAKHVWILQQAKEREEDAAAASAKPQGPKKYVLVRFMEKSDPNDLPHVPIAVQGRQLRGIRGKECVLPQEFVEGLQHAVQQQWEPNSDPKPGEPPARIVGQFLRYPFTVVREASSDEFQAALKEGNALTKAGVDEVLRQNQS